MIHYLHHIFGGEIIIQYRYIFRLQIKQSKKEKAKANADAEEIFLDYRANLKYANLEPI